MTQEQMNQHGQDSLGLGLSVIAVKRVCEMMKLISLQPAGSWNCQHLHLVTFVGGDAAAMGLPLVP